MLSLIITALALCAALNTLPERQQQALHVHGLTPPGPDCKGI